MEPLHVGCYGNFESRFRRFAMRAARVAFAHADDFGFHDQPALLQWAVGKQQILFANGALCELLCERAIGQRGFTEDNDARSFFVEPVNDREVRPARLAVPQPVVNALAREGTRRVRVHAGGLVDHQQMLVFKENARSHKETSNIEH